MFLRVVFFYVLGDLYSAAIRMGVCACLHYRWGKFIIWYVQDTIPIITTLEYPGIPSDKINIEYFWHGLDSSLKLHCGHVDNIVYWFN